MSGVEGHPVWIPGVACSGFHWDWWTLVWVYARQVMRSTLFYSDAMRRGTPGIGEVRSGSFWVLRSHYYCWLNNIYLDKPWVLKSPEEFCSEFFITDVRSLFISPLLPSLHRTSSSVSKGLETRRSSYRDLPSTPLRFSSLPLRVGSIATRWGRHVYVRNLSKRT